MEQVIYSLLSGAGSGGLVVFFYQALQMQKLKETMRKEFYAGLEKVEKECNKYTDAKHNDIKEQFHEVKEMLREIQKHLLNNNHKGE